MIDLSDLDPRHGSCQLGSYPFKEGASLLPFCLLRKIVTGYLHSSVVRLYSQ